MNNELTKMDIQKMQEEIDYKSLVLRPKLLEDLATARAFGDLSENFEYKAAKLELRRWAPNHEKCNRGVTLTAEEAKKLLSALQKEMI